MLNKPHTFYFIVR